MIKTIFGQKIFKQILKTQNAMLSHKSEPAVKNQENGSHYKNRRKDISWSDEEKLLLSMYPQVKKEILDDQLLVDYPHRPDVRERYSKLLDYAIHLDKSYYASSVTSIRAYKSFEKPSKLTEENLKRACMLGWCTRVGEAAMIVLDDILDNSQLRYNKPTRWRAVGSNIAMLDGLFLKTSLSYLTLRHFSSHPQFVNIQRLLIRSVASVSIATTLEFNKQKLEDFEANENLEKAYPFTVPPIQGALYLADIDDPRLHSIVREFCIDIAKFTKAEDDVICVYNPTSVTEKDCTDAAEGLITWFAVQVSKYGTPSQKKTFEENYGKYDKDALAKIYNLYKEMRLKEVFCEYRETFYDQMYKRIEEMPKELPGEIFLDMLDNAVLGKYRS